MDLKEVLALEIGNDIPVSVDARRLENITIEKPTKAVQLLAAHEDEAEVKKYVLDDKTDDLVTLPYGKTKDCFEVLNKVIGPGFIVYDIYSKETWYAPDIICLNKNFVFREDVRIVQVENKQEAVDTWLTFNEDIAPSRLYSRFKYILDDPAAGTYWPFSSPDYVPKHYGKPILQGTVIHKSKNTQVNQKKMSGRLAKLNYQTMKQSLYQMVVVRNLLFLTAIIIWIINPYYGSQVVVL